MLIGCNKSEFSGYFPNLIWNLDWLEIKYAVCLSKLNWVAFLWVEKMKNPPLGVFALNEKIFPEIFNARAFVSTRKLAKTHHKNIIAQNIQVYEVFLFVIFIRIWKISQQSEFCFGQVSAAKIKIISVKKRSEKCCKWWVELATWEFAGLSVQHNCLRHEISWFW